jgi:hypothetical protein
MFLFSKLRDARGFRKLPSNIFSPRLIVGKSWVSSSATSPLRFIPAGKPHLHHPLRRFSQINSKKPKRVNDFPLMAVFFNHVHMRDFSKAKETYDFILSAHPECSLSQRKQLLSAMISLCEKGDQLEFALKLRNDLKENGFELNESNILPLIKCASDKGDISLAKQYLQEIVESNYIVRHRDTSPVLHAIVDLSSKSSSYTALDECSRLKEYGLYPRPQELELVLASGVRTGAIKEEEFRDKLSNLISIINHTYCAIEHVAALRVHQAVQVGTVASEDKRSVDYLTDMFKKGILVDKCCDISGKVSMHAITYAYTVSNGRH